MDKRIFLTSAVVSASIFSHSLLQADELESKVGNIEKTLQSIVAENAYQKEGVVCSSGNPFFDKQSLFLLFDVLYWHAKVNNTTFCYKTENPIGVNPIEGQTQDIKFGWNFGLRAGLIYDLPHDGWNLALLYTYFNTSKSKNVFGTSVTAVIPTKSVYLFDESVVEAKSNAKIVMNSIDFLIGRETFLSPYFILAPYAGLKNSWLDFKQRTSYSGGSFLDVNSVYVKDTSDFWGIGPKLGSSAKWFLGNGFNVSGNLGFAFEYGIFDVTYEDQMSVLESNHVKLTSQSHQFAPVADFSIGIGWGKYINDYQQFLDFTLEYEGEYWFGQNQTFYVYDANISRINNLSEDISLHGATLSVKVCF